HGLFPICEYLRHLRFRNSDFGLLSGFSLRSSVFGLPRVVVLEDSKMRTEGNFQWFGLCIRPVDLLE
ncbi:MAG: hypothetical protein WCQ21_37465, partial [Verrucomicrobiota bacterium]